MMAIVAIIIIIALSLKNLSNSGYAYIGDSLLNTSGIIKVNSSTETVNIAFDTRVNAVYNTSTKPPIITNYLPKKEMIANESYSDYNYLGIGEPIYLLPGSKIIYSTKVTMAKANNSSTNIACIILFHNLIKFTDFIRDGAHSEPNRHCFIAANTTAVLSWSFNITEESQYYVGIIVEEGVTVTSNVSIIRTYYDLSQLTPEHTCIDSLSCDITTCSSVICDESYLIIETKNSTYVSYTARSRVSESIAIAIIIFIIVVALIGLIIIVIILYCRRREALRSSKYFDTASSTNSLYELNKNRSFARESRHIPRLDYDDIFELPEESLNRPQPLRSLSYNTAHKKIKSSRSSTQQPTLRRPAAMETIKHAITMTCSTDETSFMSNDQVVPDTPQTIFNYPEACTSRAEDTTLPFQQYANGM